MIKVSSIKDLAKRSLTVQVSGHAGQGLIGQDIVCSAASILTYTVAQIFTAMEHIGDLEITSMRLESGDAYLSAICKDDDSLAEALRVVVFAETGFRLLEASYPKNLQLVEADEALE